MKYLEFVFMFLVPYFSKGVHATNTTHTTTFSYNNNITSSSNNDSATENILGRTVSPKPEKKFDFDSLLTLFTKKTTTTSTTTTTAATPTTATPAPNVTQCMCGKGAKPRSIDGFSTRQSDNEGNEDLVKIQRGEVSNNHGWPWAVAIVNVASSPNFVRCGGSLISKEYILTAAHCFANITKSEIIKNYRVFLGTNTINAINGNSNSAVKAVVADYKVHPKYSPNGTPNFDVAVVRLATPVTFNSSISPVCLSQTGQPFSGKTATAVGWGDLFFGQMKGSNVLREVGLNILGNADCNRTTNGIITNQMLCTAGDPTNKGTCQGDSGGGLFYRKPTANTYTIVGITSFNFGTCASPSVFTRVSSVIDFIKGQTMKNNTFCSNTFFP